MFRNEDRYVCVREREREREMGEGEGEGERLLCLYPLHCICRVWRYRGGRDGHETLQQFMNFLGREKKTDQVGGERDQAVERLDDTGSRSVKKQSPNPYAGVVVFCVPMVAEIGRGIVDINSFQVSLAWRRKNGGRCIISHLVHCLSQVDQMVAYAVGEMMKQEKEEGDQMKLDTAPELAGASEDEVEEEEKEAEGVVDNQLQVTVTQAQSSPGRRRLLNDSSCYEVVTAWVHPR